jgi:hypothetical protein
MPGSIAKQAQQKGQYIDMHRPENYNNETLYFNKPSTVIAT